MAKLIPVIYVGKKPQAFDNVARSGKTWNGAGDVQEVTDAQAKMLIKFPDQWQLADDADLAQVNQPTSITGTNEDGDSVTVDPASLTKPLEKMNKAELTALAIDRWGKELDSKLSKKQMIDQLEEWQETLDVTSGVPE
jgi:hypothetical protein